MLKFANGRVLPNGRPVIDIAIRSFGYKSSFAICRRYGFTLLNIAYSWDSPIFHDRGAVIG